VEIAQAMQSLGLRPDWRFADRRPPPADTFDEQAERIAMSGRAVRMVRLRVPIMLDEQRLVERLCDRAMAERERVAEPAVAQASRPPTAEECIAYAAAGGGAWGTFATFKRRFAGDPVMPATPEPATPAAPAPPAPPRRPREPRPTPAPAMKRRTAPPLVIARRATARG